MLALALLLLPGVVVAGRTQHAPQESLIGKKAPEITRTDLQGKHLDLASYRGKVILLNFWATWCGPCQVEMPVFADWQRRYGTRGLQIIGISMDDDVAPVRKTVSRLKINYPVAMGDDVLGRRYGGVLGLPLTYVIDRHGVVRGRFQGETEPKAIEKEILTLLGTPQSLPAAYSSMMSADPSGVSPGRR